MTAVDVVVVGGGPNGLAAAVTAARAGLSVHLFEAKSTLGGGARTGEITAPGYHHDLCSAVHPMAFASPFFRQFGLADRVDFVIPEVSYAHALAPGSAAVAFKDLDRTATGLGADGSAWRRLFAPLVASVDDIIDVGMNQLLRIPRHPVSAVRYGLRTLEQGSPLWNLRFGTPAAAALLTGVNAHTVGAMPTLPTSGAGLLLATLAHVYGWPIPIGGSQRIIDSLADDLKRNGGRITTGARIDRLDDLPAARATLFDTSARALLSIAGDRLPDRYRRALTRFRYGNGVAKVDFALAGPVPWISPELRSAPTIHLGGDRQALARSEGEVKSGRIPERPYLLISQPSLVDPTRAPAGRHTLWTYTHVPRGCEVDMAERITELLESYAPGFRDLVIARHSVTAARLEDYNANYIGGDFASGAVTLPQLVKRPIVSPWPWRTPVDGLYLCSSSTVPGPGVHGMSGWHAARLALRDRFGLPAPELGPADRQADGTTTEHPAHRGPVEERQERPR